MSRYLPYLIVGITTGAVYALVSAGLVLTYSTSGIFNFAHGAIGMFGTYIFYELRVNVGVPTAVAVGVVLLVVSPLMGITIDRVLLRRLESRGAAAQVVVSLGLLVALQGFCQAVFGAQVRRVDPIFPTSTFGIPGANVGLDQAIVVAISVLSGIGLAVYLRATHVGLQNRAVVADRELAELVRCNSRAITTRAWMLGCAFASLAGILLAPFVQLNSVLLSLLVVQAFGAAIVGRLRSLSLATVGAYGVAVLAALATKFSASHNNLSGLPTSVPFIVLFAVLVFSRKGSFAEVARTRTEHSSTRSGPRRNSVRTVVVAAAVAASLPAVLNDSNLLTATSTLTFVLILASLSLVLGLSRQVSLCQAAFVVFGATSLSHLLSAGLPYPVALPLAALIIVPVGAIVAIPAIRLSGLFLALATFGFGVLAQYLLFQSSLAFGSSSIVRVERPSLVQSGTSFYYLALGLVVFGVVIVEVVKVTRLGRILRALADSPIAVESLGIEPTTARVLVFCLSAFLAAIAGGLQATLFQLVSLGSFDFFQSLLWVAVLVAAGARTVGGSILGAILLVAVPTAFSSTIVAEWQPVVFGVAAIVLAQMPNGLVSLLRVPDLSAVKERQVWRADRRRRAERFAATALARTR